MAEVHRVLAQGVFVSALATVHFFALLFACPEALRLSHPTTIPPPTHTPTPNTVRDRAHHHSRAPSVHAARVAVGKVS